MVAVAAKESDANALNICYGSTCQIIYNLYNVI